MLWICWLCCLFVVQCCLWFIVQCCLSIVYVVYLLFMLSMVYCPLLSITIKQSNYQEKVKRKISYKHCKHLLITYQKAIKTHEKPHQITIWKPWFYLLKPMVSHPKTHAFTAWNPWFRKPKVSTMKSVRKREQKMIDCYFTKTWP